MKTPSALCMLCLSIVFACRAPNFPDQREFGKGDAPVPSALREATEASTQHSPLPALIDELSEICKFEGDACMVLLEGESIWQNSPNMDDSLSFSLQRDWSLSLSNYAEIIGACVREGSCPTGDDPGSTAILTFLSRAQTASAALELGRFPYKVLAGAGTHVVVLVRLDSRWGRDSDKLQHSWQRVLTQLN